MHKEVEMVEVMVGVLWIESSYFVDYLQLNCMSFREVQILLVHQLQELLCR